VAAGGWPSYQQEVRGGKGGRAPRRKWGELNAGGPSRPVGDGRRGAPCSPSIEGRRGGGGGGQPPTPVNHTEAWMRGGWGRSGAHQAPCVPRRHPRCVSGAPCGAARAGRAPTGRARAERPHGDRACTRGTTLRESRARVSTAWSSGLFAVSSSFRLQGPGGVFIPNIFRLGRHLVFGAGLRGDNYRRINTPEIFTVLMQTMDRQTIIMQRVHHLLVVAFHLL